MALCKKIEVIFIPGLDFNVNTKMQWYFQLVINYDYSIVILLNTIIVVHDICMYILVPTVVIRSPYSYVIIHCREAKSIDEGLNEYHKRKKSLQEPKVKVCITI